ncbi:MAG: molybdopterin-dependent oxidoreductase, partial [Anaerolineales bacterium]|nr:molybdopterin-dependent oxidoreductase [Anaerolineales bacterium]
MNKVKDPQIKRRDFLKLSGGAAAVATLGGKLFGKPAASLVKTSKTGSAAKEDVWLGGDCNLCRLSDCVNRVHLINGVVVEIEGNPDSPSNEGRLCPRGMSAGINLYNPYRVKAPMKRTNPEKGLNVDPKWVEISWEEAYTITAKHLKEALEYDPRSLMLNSGFGVRETQFRSPFLGAFGSPNSVSSNGPLCAVHYATNLVQANMPISACDMSHTEYMITIGRSVGANHGVANGGTSKLLDAIQRGMKLVCIDPRGSAETALGEWVPIIPGTDLAFTLAMSNVMMYEIQVYDLEFLKFRSNAPYLIGDDG